MTSKKAQAGSFCSFGEESPSELCSVESFCLDRYLSDFRDRPVQERLLENSDNDPQNISIKDLEDFMSFQSPPDLDILRSKGPFER